MKVPTTSGYQAPKAMPDEAYMLMALAHMKQIGKFDGTDQKDRNLPGQIQRLGSRGQGGPTESSGSPPSSDRDDSTT